MSELSELRRRLAEARKAGGRTVPLVLRMEIWSAAIRLRNEQGLSRLRLAEQLGMSKATLNSWVDLARTKSVSTKASPKEKKKRTSPRILPIELAPKSEQAMLRQPSVRLPSGTIVVGLSIAEIAALERAL